MTAGDPFAGIQEDLDYEHVSDETVELVASGPDLPEEEAELRFLVYVGLLDLLAETHGAGFPNDEARFDRLSAVMSSFRSIEPTLRYWLFEKGSRAEQQELLSRMRGKEIAVTREWMIPRLDEDIRAYRARIEALRARLEPG